MVIKLVEQGAFPGTSPTDNNAAGMFLYERPVLRRFIESDIEHLVVVFCPTVTKWICLHISTTSSPVICLHPKHFHHLIAEVVDYFDGDTTGLGFVEWAGCVAV